MTFDQLKEKALSLPLKPGVYLMMDREGTVIYVGKAKALKNRVSQYFHDQAAHTEKTRAMVAQIDHFDTIVAGSEFEALVLENSLIKRHKPRYNILLKDDKGYPYIRLSVKEAYPRFSIQGRMADDGARYFGPFGGRHDTQSILDALRTALKLPACGKVFPRDQGKERPCLNYHMGQCDGYCRKEVPRSQHQQAIEQAVRLLEGKFGEVEKELKGQMEEAAEALEFEKAAALRDRLRAITLLGKRQKVVAGYLADTDVLGLYMGEVRSGVAVLHFQEGELTGRDLEVFPTAGAGGGNLVRLSGPVLYPPGPAAPADSPAGGHGGSGGPGAAALPPGRAEGGAGDPPAGGQGRPDPHGPGECPDRVRAPDHPGGADSQNPHPPGPAAGAARASPAD